MLQVRYRVLRDFAVSGKGLKIRLSFLTWGLLSRDKKDRGRLTYCYPQAKFRNSTEVAASKLQANAATELLKLATRIFNCTLLTSPSKFYSQYCRYNHGRPQLSDDSDAS